MTAAAIPPAAVVAAPAAVDPNHGITTAGPGTTTAPAAPAVAPAAPAAPAAATAPSTDGSLLGSPKPTYDLKAEGMHADDIKVFADVLGEHKVEGKAGQAILDKMLPAFRARSEKQVAELQAAWRAENAKDPEHRARVDAALSVVSDKTREALRSEVYVDSPALAALFKEFGDYVRRVTKQDTTVPSSAPVAPASRAPDDISAAAFAEAYRK